MTTVPSAPAADEGEVLRCARHPSVETVLRCNKCDTPICPRCSIPTPVGTRCPTCAQVRRYSVVAKPRDLVLGALGGFAAAFAGGVLFLTFLGFFGLIAPAVIGFGTGWTVSRVAGGRRNRDLAVLAVVVFVLGWLLAPAGALLLRGDILPPLGLLLPGLIAAATSNPFSLLGVALGGFLAWMRAR